MKALCTRLAGAGLATTDLQFYNHFVNSFPADYDMVIAVHAPPPSYSVYSVDSLCEGFGAIEHRKELHTSKAGGTIDEPIALMAGHKGCI